MSPDPVPTPAQGNPAQTAAWLPLGAGVRLVATHPCGLYVLDKPEGVLSHPNKKSEEKRSLLTASYSLQRECFHNFQGEAAAHLPEALYLLHRLDSATSGLLLLADNEPLAQSVRNAFAKGTVGKSYLALCANYGGAKPGASGSWTDRLQRQRAGAGNSPIHVQAGSGASACTQYSCKQVDTQLRALALLELNPISGRTHQLRVHCAEHSLPIIGDGKYGDFRLNRELTRLGAEKRLFLHAARLSLNFTFNARTISMDLRSAPPASFNEMLKNSERFTKAFQSAGNYAASKPTFAQGGARRNEGSHRGANKNNASKSSRSSHLGGNKGGGTRTSGKVTRGKGTGSKGKRP